MKTLPKKIATAIPLLLALLLAACPPGFAAAQSGGGQGPAPDFLLQQTVYDTGSLQAPQPATAGTEDAGFSPAEFYVQARLPQNQRQGSTASYFDLVVEPAGSQTLEVVVYNNSSETIVVDVAANSASTNRNGVIDYATPDVRDTSLRAPFADMATVRDSVLTIPANSQAVAQVDLQIPEAPFEGNVLGGLVFTRRLPEADSAGSDSSRVGASVQNQYRYVVGVLLTQNTAYSGQPTFQLLQVYPATINTRGALVHNLRNEQPVIIKDMEISVRLFHQGEDEPLQTYALELADMAPSSVMPVTMFLDEALQPGDYVTTVQARLPSGIVWRLQRSFTITGNEANEINEALPDQPINWLLILIIVVAVLLLLILILLVLLLKRKKDRDKAGQSAVYKRPKE